MWVKQVATRQQGRHPTWSTQGCHRCLPWPGIQVSGVASALPRLESDHAILAVGHSCPYSRVRAAAGGGAAKDGGWVGGFHLLHSKTGWCLRRTCTGAPSTACPKSFMNPCLRWPRPPCRADRRPRRMGRAKAAHSKPNLVLPDAASTSAHEMFSPPRNLQPRFAVELCGLMQGRLCVDEARSWGCGTTALVSPTRLADQLDIELPGSWRSPPIRITSDRPYIRHAWILHQSSTLTWPKAVSLSSCSTVMRTMRSRFESVMPPDSAWQ